MLHAMKRSLALSSMLAAVAVVAACGKAHSGPAAPAKLPDAPLAVGAHAPDFTAKAQDGSTVSLAKLRGHPVVLYFYPKDDTTGCTAEAKAFEAGIGDFQAIGASVIGVSHDDLESHEAFAQKYALQFPLLPDENGAIAALFGVVQQAPNIDHRTTFLIGPDGKIAQVWPSVDVAGHEAEVLDAVKKISKT
jgi:peroxiredoxin Q/BCP